ncbi:permease [Thermodesulfobacteriota bacterium]
MSTIINEATLIFKDLLHGVEHIWVYFLIGIAIEALIRTFKWHVKIRKMLNKFGGYAIIVATLLGTLSPLCACGTLPLIISLLIGGLSLAPAMALLVSAPLMSPAGYQLTVTMLGPEWANARLGSAIFMGLFAGYMTLFLQKRGFETHEIFKEDLPEGDFHDPNYPDERLRCICGEQFSNKLARKTDNKILIYFAKMYEGAKKIGKFVLIGVVIEVFAERFIPREWFMSILESNNPLIVPTISVAAIPLHINQITAVSFLWGFNDILIESGRVLSKSVGIAFLVGGPVTALPAMAVFLSLFKKRVFLLYVALCVSGTLICSYLYVILYPYLNKSFIGLDLIEAIKTLIF